MTGVKVVKFGGSSLADANQFKKVADIVKTDEARDLLYISNQESVILKIVK